MKPRMPKRERKELTYDHSVERTVANKLSSYAKTQAHRCHVTPKRVELENGERYERATGRRIMPLAARVWGSYRHSIDPQTIQKIAPGVSTETPAKVALSRFCAVRNRQKQTEPPRIRQTKADFSFRTETKIHCIGENSYIISPAHRRLP